MKFHADSIPPVSPQTRYLSEGEVAALARRKLRARVQAATPCARRSRRVALVHHAQLRVQRHAHGVA